MTRAEKYMIQSEGLFDYWKSKPASGVINHSEDVFISDGVVDPDTWFNQECRPLFLLKEAYNGESDWSLTNHLRESTENTAWPGYVKRPPSIFGKTDVLLKGKPSGLFWFCSPSTGWY